jgi:hypothetical protein
MTTEIVFETHSSSEDNGLGRASGWNHSRFSAEGDGRRILVIGHVATRWAFDEHLGGVPIEDLVRAAFAWREGWEHRVGD